MAKHKILIIEDEPTLLALLSEFLGTCYEVLSARSGAEGCRLFDINPVSLILLDLKLRDMDGVEVLRLIRGKSLTTQVIILTGNSNHEAAVRCADLGVQGYILKPMKLEDLKRRVDHCLGINTHGILDGIKDRELDEKLKAAGSIVKGALKVIHERYRDPSLSRNLIAEAVGISEDYLSKQFQKDCGFSIPEYIRRLRMAEAGKLLVSTNGKISEVAMSLGYSNLSYFSAIFKKHFDMTPEQYRRVKRIETFDLSATMQDRGGQPEGLRGSLFY